MWVRYMWCVCVCVRVFGCTHGCLHARVCAVFTRLLCVGCGFPWPCDLPALLNTSSSSNHGPCSNWYRLSRRVLAHTGLSRIVPLFMQGSIVPRATVGGFSPLPSSGDPALDGGRVLGPGARSIRQPTSSRDGSHCPPFLLREFLHFLLWKTIGLVCAGACGPSLAATPPPLSPRHTPSCLPDLSPHGKKRWKGAIKSGKRRCPSDWDLTSRGACLTAINIPAVQVEREPSPLVSIRLKYGTIVFISSTELWGGCY